MDIRINPIRSRLQALREVMVQERVDALLVPSADPHLSEYLPERWQGREHFSGFTGSMGTLVVMLDQAALFADSRYWVQAEAELQGTGVNLVKIPTGTATHHIQWLVEQVLPGGTVAVDAQVLGLAAAQQLRTALDAAGIQLRTDADLLQGAWPERPALPTEPVYAHQVPHAPMGRSAKVEQVRQAMARLGASHHFVSTVDDTAWITNLRGSDVSYNPVFLSHLLIAPSTVTLFVGEGKVPAALINELRADGVLLAPYEQAPLALSALPPEAVLLLDPRRVTLGLRQAVSTSVKVIEGINPSTLLKSRKTSQEAGFIREAMARDGAAMCAFYAWFEQALGRERITELTLDERLSAERARQSGFVGLSFPVIAGFAANGAMPHYRATPSSHAVIEGNSLLLIDSGGQYLGGTTDVTRVWPVGEVSAAMRRDYTLVLKGTMALSRARFPRGTLSPMLDALARAPLWEQGIEFGHGTGHGVGYFLNVHEGPQSISKAIPEPHMAMEPGMITSIEPGVYRPGHWGVRIENLVLNVPASTVENGGFGDFLEFETLTLCPIDTRCIEHALMREDELQWLNAYHAVVRERLLPLVQGDAREWLIARTQAL